MRKYFYLPAILAALFLSLAPGVVAQADGDDPGSVVGPVHIVRMEGVVTAGQKTYLQRQVALAEEIQAQLLLIELNTPGGLVDATLEINELFLNAPLPVAVLVTPSGAIAGSAGAFILMSADIAAMAPGTTVGAAQPITISTEGTDAADEKTTIFYASHLRNLAAEKGRPPDLAERFVTENLTLGAREAEEKGLIEFLAYDSEELLDLLDGEQLEKGGITYTLATAGATLSRDDMTLAERLQNWLSNPQIAFLVLIAGVMGIYFGLSAPGTIVPEVSGVILLILGIYGIGLFDTNTTGIVLILLGLGLIIAEFFVAGFGILGIGGGLALIAGAILLPTEPLMARDWYDTFIRTVVGTVLGFVIVILVVVQRIIRSRSTWSGGSDYFKAPTGGRVVEDLDPDGMVKTRGELWRARSADGTAIPKGSEVQVESAENLILVVRRMDEDKKEEAKGAEG